MHKQNTHYLIHDIAIITISIVVAIFIVKLELVSTLLGATKDMVFVGSFIAGFFFTSVFTTAPAIVMLGEISQTSSVLSVAFVGAMGAVLGDLVIFRFIRDSFADHVMGLVGHRQAGRKVNVVHHLKFLRWVTFLVGGMIIASPLPDELGIGLLGFSKMQLRWFIPLSFVFNFIGIVLIGVVANAL